jgi:hypothetical protein
LIVARTIQILGGSFETECVNPEGRRPDFKARFGDKTVAIEVIAPEFDREISAQEKRAVPLLELIESRIPSAWSVLIEELPEFEASKSKSEFKKALDHISEEPPPKNDQDWRKIIYQFPQGTLQLTLVPGRQGDSCIIGGPVYTGWGDAEKRIVHALRKKRSQVRSESVPAILAIVASGMSCSVSDFQRVLLGCHVTTVSSDRKDRSTRFEPAGEFAKGRGTPTYSGVLAFIGMSPFKCGDPVLFVHPRATTPLPDHFDIIERRSLVSQSVEIRPAARARLLDSLNWARL